TSADAYSSTIRHRKHKDFKQEKTIANNIGKPTQLQEPTMVQLSLAVLLIDKDPLYFKIPVSSSDTVLQLKEMVQGKAPLSADEQDMSGVYNSLGLVTDEDIRDEMTIKEVCQKFNSQTFSIYQHLKSKKNK